MKTTTEEQASRLAWVARETRIPPRSERILLVQTAAKRQAQVRSLQDRDSTQVDTTVTDIIDVFPNRPFYVIVLIATNTALFFANHQRMVTTLRLPSSVIDNKFDGPSSYTSSASLHESFNLICHQLHVNRFQQIVYHKEVKQKDDNMLTENWQSEATIPDKYNAHEDQFIQLLSKF